MVENYFKLNIPYAVLHSPIFIFKRLVTVTPTFAIIIHTCTKNLNAVKAGAEARKNNNNYMQL